MRERSEARREGSRPSLVTTIAVAVTAYALFDLVHEVAGHGIATLLVPNVRALSLTTVALQTSRESRIVAAAGSIANVLVGLAALGLFHRATRFSATPYFLWLFGSANLMNGVGYLFYSALTGLGDWAVVIEGLPPGWLWRLGLGIVGAVGYVWVVRLAAGELARAVERNLAVRAAIARVVFVSYVAGGVLIIAGAALNPISGGLVLLSGVSSGFAATAGLLRVPIMVDDRTVGVGSGKGLVAPSAGWIAAGVVVGFLFVAVVGPGIRL
jgi:hypothetical protein